MQKQQTVDREKNKRKTSKSRDGTNKATIRNQKSTLGVNAKGRNNEIKKTSVSCVCHVKNNIYVVALIIFFILTIIAYQFNIALFLLLFLFPVIINSSLNIPLHIMAWFGLNNLIFIKNFSVFFDEKLSPVIFYSNILIVSVVNFFLYVNTFYILYKKNKKNIHDFFEKGLLKKIIFLITANLILGVIIWDKFIINIFEYIFICVVSGVAVSWLLLNLFPKIICIYIGSILSLAPLISLVSAYVSILFILKSIYLPEYFYITYMSGFNFLFTFQIISISLIIFYFFGKKTVPFNYTSIVIILLCLGIGVVLQNKYINLFNY